ncbi:MAG: hypothetical protein R2704_14430 [Microthrixaceae bacterium]
MGDRAARRRSELACRWAGLWAVRAAAVLGAVALVSAACGGGGSAEPIPNTASSTSTTASAGTTGREAGPAEPGRPETAPADTSPPESTVPDTAAGDPSVPSAFDAPPSVVAWGTGGLPEGTAQAVHESGAIASTTVVVGGSLGLVSSAAADGASVDQTAEGRAIPLDTLAYDPASYRPFVSDATADALSALGPDEALLGATSAELRRVGIGGTLTVDSGRTLTVKGEVPDAEVAGAEVLISPARPPTWASRSPGFCWRSRRDRWTTPPTRCGRRVPTDPASRCAPRSRPTGSATPTRWPPRP